MFIQYPLQLGWAAGCCAPLVVPASFKHLKSTVPLPLALAPKCCCWFCHDTAPKWPNLSILKWLMKSYESYWHQVGFSIAASWDQETLHARSETFFQGLTFQYLSAFGDVASSELKIDERYVEWVKWDWQLPSEPRIVGMHVHNS